MARIPMVGDAPRLEDIFKLGLDPNKFAAEAYFDCLERASVAEGAGESADAKEFTRLAETSRKMLAKYGYVPALVSGVAQAVPG